jgi:exonuclease VII large subunit
MGSHVHIKLQCHKHYRMSSMKFVIASQAWNISAFKNLKRRVLQCCSNIYFNKQCLLHGLTPKYANIRVPRTSAAAMVTQRKSIRLRLKDEIKFLYMKKAELNKQLFRMHLTVANELGKEVHWILNSINDIVLIEMQHKYKTLDKKLEKLKLTRLLPTGY